MSVANIREIRELLAQGVLPYFMVKGSDIKARPGEVDDNGNQGVIIYGADGEVLSILAPSMDPQDPVGVNVAAADAEIVAANPNRTALVMVNDSDEAMYIAVGKPAVANVAPRVNSAGGVYILSRYGTIFSTAAIHAVHGGAGNKVLTVQEFI